MGRGGGGEDVRYGLSVITPPGKKVWVLMLRAELVSGGIQSNTAEYRTGPDTTDTTDTTETLPTVQ